MLNIKSILSAVYKDLSEGKDTVIVENDQHVIDVPSGVKFHLYDDYFQMSRGSDIPVSMSNFTKEEQSVIMGIKELITDPQISMDKKVNHKKHVTENRRRFSDWFENPQPVAGAVSPEEDTEEYTR